MPQQHHQQPASSSADRSLYASIKASSTGLPDDNECEQTADGDHTSPAGGGGAVLYSQVQQTNGIIPTASNDAQPEHLYVNA